MSSSNTGARDVGVEPSVSTTQKVVEDIRQRIIRGELPPGEKLKVETLKALLQTGASPIREALSLLTSDQLVERIDQRGFRVAPVGSAHFREILALRCELDIIALRASIQSGDTAWQENLVLAHHRLSQATRDDIERWESLHKKFHAQLLSACGSPILTRFCDQLYDLNIRYRYLAGKSVRYGKRNVEQEHKAILDAVLKGDSESASGQLVTHYTLTGDFLADQFS